MARFLFLFLVRRSVMNRLVSGFTTAVLAAVFIVFTGAFLTACGPTGSGDADASVSVIDAPPGQQPDAAPGTPDAYVPPPDAICGEQSEEIELINLGDPPDLLILLDRSGSMILPPNFPSPGDSKWTIMTNVLADVTAQYDMNINFGLAVFPTDNDCGVSNTPAVSIGPDKGDAIATWMGSNSANGNTPSQYGLQAALDIYNSIPVNDAGRYVLFATDGAPNCGGDPPNVDIGSEAETVDGVEALAAAGIPTFVLGFGAFLGLPVDNLNDCGDAGGVPNPVGPDSFYHADNASELEDVLLDIAGGIIIPSCSFELAEPPPVPDDVTVTFDGDPVPRSPGHNDGWDYSDANTITFYGSYCELLQNGGVADVSFIYGCPGPVVD